MIPDNYTRQTGRIQNSFSNLGKLPPQALELEETVLGAMMLEKNAYYEVSDFVKPEIFYKDSHQKVLSAIQDLARSRSPIDIATVTHKLRANGDLEMVGGAYAITELTHRVASSANIAYHSRIIYQKHLQRELIRISTEAVTSAYEDTSDILELLEKVQTEIFNMLAFQQAKQAEKIGTLAMEARVEMAQKPESGFTGVPTGIKSLDEFSSGWQDTDLTIIAARPGMGKTAFVMTCARNAAVDFKKPVVIFSLEMSAKQLTNRMISSEAEVRLEYILDRKLNSEEFQKIDDNIVRLHNAPIIIDDTPALSVFDFRTKAKRYAQLYGAELIIIDYLQLMRGENSGGKFGNREQEIGTISRTLKQVAKELNVPVLALSQLSRAVESRPGGAKRPMLSDLRESGSIEQDADNVIFLYRPEYYGLETDEENNSTYQMAEVIWAKRRSGACGKKKIRFQGQYMKFSDFPLPDVGNQQAQLALPNDFVIKHDDNDDEPF